MLRSGSILIAFIGILLIKTYADAAKCKCQCPYNYNPICAADSSGLEDTYPNKCAMECYKCTHNEVLVIRNTGECMGNSLSPTNVQATSKKTNQRTPSCNCQCPFNYSPVCAADSKGVEDTYPNLCSLKCYSCTYGKELKIRKEGECEKKSGSQTGTRSMNLISNPKTPTSSSKCNCQCTLNYTPVCAADSKGVEETFPNQCAFQCYECTHQKGYVIRKQGECSGKTTQRPKLPATGNSNIQRNPTSKCKCQCPRNSDPVCAKGPSGRVKSFSNMCIFECYKCTYGEEYVSFKKGDCYNSINSTPNNQNSSVKCKCDCTLNYTPLCAVDSRGAEQTFPNRCSLDCYNCTHQKDYVFRKNGECPQSNASKSRRPTSRTA